MPVIGCGTYGGFDVGPGDASYKDLGDVLKTMLAQGGTVIDSSPMYGRSEATVGELLKADKELSKPFLATKVWTSGKQAGIEQMKRSMKLLGTENLDLMQIHNLLDWQVHLATLRDWKERGIIRYIGVTHYTSHAYGALEQVLRHEQLDFVQLNYSVDETEAANRILPLAADRGIAVIVNRPFGGGSLFRQLRQKELPAWAAEIGATSWAQIMLKYVLSHPAVICAIPGTARPAHMLDNMKAGLGEIPPMSFWSQSAHKIDL